MELTVAASLPVRIELAALEGRTHHVDALGAHTMREGLLVRAIDGDRVGLGEASPLPGHSEDDLAACRAALARLDRLSPGDARIATLPPAVAFAVETALLDLSAQRAGAPMAAMLARAPAARIETQALLPLDGDPSTISPAAQAVKLKLGADRRRAAAQVRAVRAFRGSIVLRVDLNGAGLDDELVAALVAAAVDYCEDPCPVETLGRLPFPVAIDVRPSNVEAALAAVEDGRVSVIVIKPTVLGGLRRTLAIAERARALGARVVISHALESPIGLAACAHLALALGAGEVHGLAPHPGIGSFVAGGSPVHVPAWIGSLAIERPAAPGLGASA